MILLVLQKVLINLKVSCRGSYYFTVVRLLRAPCIPSAAKLIKEQRFLIHLLERTQSNESPDIWEVDPSKSRVSVHPYPNLLPIAVAHDKLLSTCLASRASRRRHEPRILSQPPDEFAAQIFILEQRDYKCSAEIWILQEHVRHIGWPWTLARRPLCAQLTAIALGPQGPLGTAFTSDPLLAAFAGIAGYSGLPRIPRWAFRALLPFFALRPSLARGALLAV